MTALDAYKIRQDFAILDQVVNDEHWHCPHDRSHESVQNDLRLLGRCCIIQVYQRFIINFLI